MAADAGPPPAARTGGSDALAIVDDRRQVTGPRANLLRHTSFSLAGSPHRTPTYASGCRLARASSGSQLDPVLGLVGVARLRSRSPATLNVQRVRLAPLASSGGAARKRERRRPPSGQRPPGDRVCLAKAYGYVTVVPSPVAVTEKVPVL